MTVRRRLLRAALLVTLPVVLGACATVTAPPAPVLGAATTTPAADGTPAPAAPDSTPTGRVRVAYPDPVVSFWQQDEEDLAAGDLAALWALPLYRVDDLGRLRAGLATSARVHDDADGWSVEVDLAAGTWSDGVPVTAADVVATATALREVRPAAWSAFVEATALDDDTVVLRFDRPYASWPWLLSGAPGVLPEHRLAEVGLDGWDPTLEVTGGWFRLAERDPELRSSWMAHAGSPLGAPGLAEVEVLVVPDHDVALGLLDRDEVDVVLGHVALDAAPRAAEVAGVQSAVAFGGTRVELLLELGGSTDRADRRAALAALDPAATVDGLLREAGRLPGGLVPALPPGPLLEPESAVEASIDLQVAATVEGVGLLARLVQSELSIEGIAAELVRLEPPQTVLRPIATDARLRVVRVAPGRSVAGLLAALGLEPGEGVVADAAGLADADPMGRLTAPPGPYAAAVSLVAEEGALRPLAELGVAHVWRPSAVEGVAPSGWPGLALWDVGAWRVPVG